MSNISTGLANHIHNFTINWREKIPNTSTNANTFYQEVLYVCCSICGEVKKIAPMNFQDTNL